MRGSEKRQARRGAARLQALSGLHVARRSDAERIAESLQNARNEDVYAAAQHCAACQMAIQNSGDDTALCPTHLARALLVP